MRSNLNTCTGHPWSTVVWDVYCLLGVTWASHMEKTPVVNFDLRSVYIPCFADITTIATATTIKATTKGATIRASTSTMQITIAAAATTINATPTATTGAATPTMEITTAAAATTIKATTTATTGASTPTMEITTAAAATTIKATPTATRTAATASEHQKQR